MLDELTFDMCVCVIDKIRTLIIRTGRVQTVKWLAAGLMT